MDAKKAPPDNASMANQKQQKQVRHHVKQWRKKRDLTQERLAERVERSRGLIAQYESGETEMPEEMIYALANALNITTGELLERDPGKEGLLVDITDALRGKDPALQAEVLGFIRGRLRSA